MFADCQQTSPSRVHSQLTLIYYFLLHVMCRAQNIQPFAVLKRKSKIENKRYGHGGNRAPINFHARPRADMLHELPKLSIDLRGKVLALLLWSFIHGLNCSSASYSAERHDRKQVDR